MYHHANDKLVAKKQPSFWRNAPGPFYVSDQCIICGLPVETAPENIKWHCNTDCSECPTSCFVAKQPESETELELIIEAMTGSETENIRYCGTDKRVLDKLRAEGLARLCDAS
jgi:ferredoxin